MKENYLNDLYDSVKEFNRFAGSDVTKQGFINQQKVLQEEVDEISAGITNNDLVETLGEVVDTLFVALGHLDKLEILGCDVQGAIVQKCVDNATKFTEDFSVITQSLLHYNNKGVNVHWTEDKLTGKYVLKDENGKIRKPLSFVSTNLTKYVPKELIAKGLE